MRVILGLSCALILNDVIDRKRINRFRIIFCRYAGIYVIFADFELGQLNFRCCERPSRNMQKLAVSVVFIVIHGFHSNISTVAGGGFRLEVFGLNNNFIFREFINRYRRDFELDF